MSNSPSNAEHRAGAQCLLKMNCQASRQGNTLRDRERERSIGCSGSPKYGGRMEVTSNHFSQWDRMRACEVRLSCKVEDRWWWNFAFREAAPVAIKAELVTLALSHLFWQEQAPCRGMITCCCLSTMS